MSNDTKKIVISDIRTGGVWRGRLFMVAVVFGPIGLGMLADSSAMQWAGFLFGILAILVTVTTFATTRTRTVHSFDEARRAIDEMERAATERR